MIPERVPEFRCETILDDGQVIVTVSGELDMSTAPELSSSLAHVLDRCPAVLTLDLAGLDFIDSTGLTLLVRTSKRLRDHDGTLHLSSPTPPVRRVLELVGLDTLLIASSG